MTVRETRKRLNRDGRIVSPAQGDHRRLKRPDKAGKVTVSARLGDNVHPETLAGIWRRASLEDEP